MDVFFGRVSVTEQVVAYQRKSIRDQATLDLVALDLPPTTFETEAIWYVPDPEQLDGLEPLPKLLGALHAAEHAMIAILPLWAMCDRWDIGGPLDEPPPADRPPDRLRLRRPRRRRRHRPARLRRARGLGRQTPSASSPAARAPTAARPASSRRNAATSTSSWTRRPRSRSSAGCSALPSGERRRCCGRCRGPGRRVRDRGRRPRRPGPGSRRGRGGCRCRRRP